MEENMDRMRPKDVNFAKPEHEGDESYRTMSRCCWSMCEKCIADYARTGKFKLCNECMDRLKATQERMRELCDCAAVETCAQSFEDSYGSEARVVFDLKIQEGLPLDKAVNATNHQIREWLHEEVKPFTVTFGGLKRRWASQIVSMLAEMDSLGDSGCSRMIGFYADGDGDFHPDIRMQDIDGIDLVKPKKPGENTRVDMVFDAG